MATAKQLECAEKPDNRNTDVSKSVNGGITVRKLGSGEWPVWEHLTLNALHMTPFASSAFLQVAAKLFDRDLSAYVALRGNEVLAGVAVFGRAYCGSRVVALVPATTYSAIVYAKSAFSSTYPAKNNSEHIAISRALVTAIRSDFRSLDLSLVPGLEDVRPWVWDGWRAEPSFTYLLDLTRELRPSYSVHKNARKCERSGARVSTEWKLEDCWSLIQQTLERQGIGGLTRAQFFQLAQSLHDSGMAWMVTVYDAQNQPVASRVQLSLPGADTVYDWFAGTSSAAFAIGASPWNVLKVMDECRERGYSYWNMCGANYEAVAKFKSEFGGDLVHGFSLRSPRPLMMSIFSGARLKAALLRQQLRQKKGK